jgi:hypothetical protein
LRKKTAAEKYMEGAPVICTVKNAFAGTFQERQMRLMAISED